MSILEKMSLTSVDIADDKRHQLNKLFPEVFSDGKVDFDQLRAVLGDLVEPSKERFGLNWPGKAECVQIIQQPSVATLKKQNSLSIGDGADNLLIEGDNLEVLKLLQKPYFASVKMIYIDPPYNTGGEFIYPDKYSETLETYLAYSGQSDTQGRKFSTNTDVSGRYHSRWLSMMYSRLYLARNLLKDDGAIFVSINDIEMPNLRLVMDDIFGEENFAGTIVWQRSKRGDAKLIATTHEYVLVYTKDRDSALASGVWRQKKEGADEVLEYYQALRKRLKNDHAAIRTAMVEFYRGLSEDDPRKANKHYSWSDDRGLYFPDNFAGPDDGRKNRPRHDILHPTTGKVCKKPSTGWRWDEDKTNWALAQNPPRIHFGPDENTIPCRKSYLIETSLEPFSSVFYADGRSATLEVEGLVGEGVFSFPKNKEVIMKLISLVCKDGDTVLDFFAGSGTTAHAVMEVNKINDQSLKFICIQLPERCAEDSRAFSAGYKTIFDILHKRVASAAVSYAEEGVLNPKFGFQCFRLSKSNFRIWDGEAGVNLEEQLSLHIEHTQKSSSPEDILYEILIKAGFRPTTAISKRLLAGKEVFSIADGALLVCLERDITHELIDCIAAADPLQVICLDEAFKGNDQLKANAVQTFKARAASQESEIVFKTV